MTDATGRVFAAPAVTVMVYPVAGLDFTLPAAAWTDSSTPVDLLTSDLQGQDVTWTLTKDGAAVSLTGSMLGDLGNLGGKVRFPEVGTYTLTASAVDALGREYSCSQTIRIYPVVGLSVSTNDMSHTDTAEDVKLTCENLGNNEVVWTVLRDGKEIVPPFDLTARGGHGFFSEPGFYTFTASVTDELGRVTTATASIQIYPVGVSGFYLPKMFHTDSVVTLVTSFEELGENPLRWSLTRNGENVPASDYVTGELTADGGKIQFKQAGEYKLRASFQDAGGRNYSHEQSFTVYPIPVIAWTMPNYAHTDSTFTVAVESKNVVVDAAIQWHIDDTYGLRQNWGTYVAGNLTTEPGEIRIKHAGVFTLGCEITDPTGRSFSFDGPSIEVLADQELQVDIIEKQVYTGETVQVRTLGNNIELPVEWSLEKDGNPADIATYVTGDLNNLGGAIQFTQGGIFRLVGTLRDGLGRTFTASDTITVLPVGSLQFSMADMEYVGNRVPVVMDKLFNPDGAKITWSAQKDGAACLIDLSTLDNDGGTVIFPEPGEYTLTATLRDSNGKTATASQSITIIFKAALTVTAPDSIHIGTKFPVGISGAGSLPVSWGVKLGGRPVTLDSNTGFLSNDGGDLALYARPPLRAVLKALILLRFQRVLFLHISPVFPGPCSLAPFHPFCGTGGAIESVVPGRGKRPPALPAVPPSDRGRREQCGAQAGVQRKDGGAEPLADQGVGDALRTDTFLAIVQKQTVSAIVVAALPHQPPGRPVLLIGHVWDFGCAHFTRSLCKILKASDLRF